MTTESMVKEMVPLTGENFTPVIFTSLHLLPIFLNKVSPEIPVIILNWPLKVQSARTNAESPTTIIL